MTTSPTLHSTGSPGSPVGGWTIGASGKLRVLRQLGSGGTADVHLAVLYGPSGFSKLVVVKVSRDRVYQPSAAMFLHEARIAGRLNHPNCAQVLDVDLHEGDPVIVYEYLEGRTLAEMRQRVGGKVPLAIETFVIGETLRGLAHAHSCRDFDGVDLHIVHRDISPQNVLITFDGQVKILDFGIAKSSRQLEQTEAGVVKGKLLYMAPEQLAGIPVDGRTDLYATGVLLWEALRGERLWGGLSDSEVILRVARGGIPVLAGVPNIPAPLAAVCDRATRPIASERYSSADEMGLALMQACVLSGLSHERAEVAGWMSEHFGESRVRFNRELDGLLTEARFGRPGEEPAGLDDEVPDSRVSLLPELRPSGGVANGSGAAEKHASLASTVAEPGSSSSLARAATERRETRWPHHEKKAWVWGTLASVGIALALLAIPALRHMTGGSVVGSPVPPSAGSTRWSEPSGAARTLASSPSAEVSRPAPPPEPASSPSVVPVPRATSSGGSAKATARRAPKATRTEPLRRGCDPPFIITAEGDKRFKPECLSSPK